LDGGAAASPAPRFLGEAFGFAADTLALAFALPLALAGGFSGFALSAGLFLAAYLGVKAL